jgi:uncharacterized protein (TIGR03437 family)
LWFSGRLHLRSYLGVWLALAGWAGARPLTAQPPDDGAGIYGVYNDATRSFPVAAPGSIILIYSGAFQVGPATPTPGPGYPLVTSLGGTSVRVNFGATVVNAYILATEAQWVRALLPSATPLGEGRLVVVYNGKESRPYKISVVPRHFAIYNGLYEPPAYVVPAIRVPRLVQNITVAGDTISNSLLKPARPGDFLVIWGTGLGAAAGDEAAAPIPGNLSIPGLAVFVGDRPARVVYAGRSGCCAGIDQVIVDIPPGIEGCNVPVWVRYAADGSGTDDIAVSIASGEGACSDPHGLSEAEVRSLAAGTLRAAQIGAYTYSPSGGWSAGFGAAAAVQVTALGSCRTGNWERSQFTTFVAPQQNAGDFVRISTPRGMLEAARRDGNNYYAAFEGPLDAGEYAVDNGEGSPDVKPFRSRFTLPRDGFTWTNRDDLTTVVLSDGITVSWTAADPSAGYVRISGSFASDGETCGGCGFVCYERADKGVFSVPRPVLERAHRAYPNPDGLNELWLSVGLRVSKRIEVPGFDIGEFAVLGPRAAKALGLQ